MSEIHDRERVIPTKFVLDDAVKQAEMQADIKHLRDSMDTKFDGFQAVITDMRGWMSRLTETVEKLADRGERTASLEHRVGSLETENRYQRDQIQEAREHGVRNAALIGVGASVSTVILTALAGLLISLFL
jgi:hypothetical protein